VERCYGFLSGKNKKLYEINFTNGQKIYATKEHKHPIFNTSGDIIGIQLNNIVKKETIKLRKGDKVYLPDFNENPINIENSLSNIDGFICGWITGKVLISNTLNDNLFEYNLFFKND